jgi:hypothetical protein
MTRELDGYWPTQAFGLITAGVCACCAAAASGYQVGIVTRSAEVEDTVHILDYWMLHADFLTRDKL